MRYLITTLILMSILIGCRSPYRSSSRLTFGDGDAILQSVLDGALTGYHTQFAEISWSGGGGGDEFSVDDSLIVYDSDKATIAAKLSKELSQLPAKRGWSSHGSGVRGDSYVSFEYKEGGARFYFDFLLTQKDKDVEILILHKGIQ